VALGIYLPFKLSAAILLGGILAELARWGTTRTETQASGQGLLFAAGLVTGEALMGIVLALPVALSTLWPARGSDPLRIFPAPPLGPWPGVIAVGTVAWLLYRSGRATGLRQSLGGSK
jgi:hypothetical protein